MRNGLSPRRDGPVRWTSSAEHGARGRIALGPRFADHNQRMADEALAQVRSFNRVVAAAFGALSDPHLASQLPRGQAGVLWEVGSGESEVRRPRSRLGLDSGQLSRLRRSLEAAKLVAVVPSPGDRRVRVARLTDARRRARADLDHRSDEVARSLVAPLSERQRSRLLAAMGDVERLLGASTVAITSVDPEHPGALHCLPEYVAELNRRSERGFDPKVGETACPHEVRPPAGEFFVAYLGGDPVGCGAVKHHPNAPAEIERMWVAANVRGLGLRRRLLGQLGARARGGGDRIARLKTGAVLFEALSLNRSSGWGEVAACHDEPFADHWFEKTPA